MALDGPTLPEIRLIIRKDLDKSSWLFTVSFIGHFLGSAALGLLYKIKRKSVLFVTITLSLALTEAVFPWCRYFYLMLTVKCLVGFFSGVINAGKIPKKNKCLVINSNGDPKSNLIDT